MTTQTHAYEFQPGHLVCVCVCERVNQMGFPLTGLFFQQMDLLFEVIDDLIRLGCPLLQSHQRRGVA